MELNASTRQTKKKQKKISQSNAEKLSNTQSSFNFTWGNAPGTVKGQALRKKQKVSAQSGKEPPKQKISAPIITKSAPIITKNKKQIISSKPKPAQQKFSNEQHVDTQKHTGFDDPPQGLIKRKHKKDKQLAKRFIAEGGTEPEVVSNTKGPPKNFSLFGQRPKDTFINARSGKSVSEKVFAVTGNKFSDLPIHKYLVSNLEKIKFTTLTTVQEKAIPVVLSGKDVLIRSQTGSGKTLAYAVPIMDALQGITPRLQRKDGVQAIIVVPTRELALQTHELFNKINTFQWLIAGHLCGGENRKSEKDRLRKGIHVLIGTPGRLLDHILHTSALKVDNVRCLVLDEADRLLDMGFRKDIIRLVESLTKAKRNAQYDPMQMLKGGQNQKKQFDSDEDEAEDQNQDEDKVVFALRDVNNKNRQTILLSATLTEGVSELADFAMKNHIFVDALDEAVANNNNISDSFVIPDTVKQEFIITYIKHRLFTLSAVILAKAKKNSKMFIFMASSQMVEYHYELFTQCLVKMPIDRSKLKTGNVVSFETNSEGSDIEDEEEVVLNTPFFKLHGSMDQKMRKEVFTAFRAAKSGVLLCTDVAARGLDVPAADCIIQYTGPQTDEDYLHRVGRTGRAGQPGSAIIFLTHEEQDYISRLAEHRVFLEQRKPEDFLVQLCELMDDGNDQRAAEALQRRYETAVAKNKDLHYTACMAYSTWNRFYNTYPTKMRSIFDYKKANLGHYATSFALRETPSQISRIVKGQVAKIETPRLNKKLANHMEDIPAVRQEKSKPKRSISLHTSEYASGLEPIKKKKKKE